MLNFVYSVRSDLQSERTREVGGVVGRSGEVEKVNVGNFHTRSI